MSTTPHPIVTALCTLRRQQRIPQITIADALNTSHTTVSQIETGNRQPKLNQLIRYAHAVGATLNITLNLLPDPPTPTHDN